jgi:hypothetical protein
MVPVKELHYGFQIEIEAIAAVDPPHHENWLLNVH